MLSAVVLSEVMATDTPLRLELAVQTGVLPQVPLKVIAQPGRAFDCSGQPVEQTLSPGHEENGECKPGRTQQRRRGENLYHCCPAKILVRPTTSTESVS